MHSDAAEWYAKYRDELIRFATALVGPSGAEDVMTNAVVRAFGSPSWPLVSERRAYLHRAVASEARMQHRSTQRRWWREAATAGAGVEPDGGVRRVELLDAIRRLTLRQRAVVYLTYWEELPAGEIAATLGVGLRTVERELTAGRRRLEDMLR